MKGVERGTGLRMSQVNHQELRCDPDRIAVASGPNLALEIAREQPTAAVISSRSQETADTVARAARNSYFRTFVNTDVIGTEFGGVLKNLIAVAIGIVDGRRLRREYQGLDHHPRPRRDDGLRRGERCTPGDAAGTRRPRRPDRHLPVAA